MVKIPSSNTVPHVSVINGQLTTTSRDIATCFGKRHTDVLERIRKLDCSPDFNARNFPLVEYIDAKGESRSEYRITRDGFSFLCMGFTGAKAAQWKERYISTFNEMAEKLAAPVPSLQFRRFLVWYDDNGMEQVKNVPMDATVISPSNADRLSEFLLHEVPQHLIGEAIATLTGRTLRLLGEHQRQIVASTAKRIG
jgi:Rha family phage regulatory protein